MTVAQFSEVEGMKALTLSDGDREITGCYIGDLLSWVMGRAQSGCAWITIMSNINICAVAALTDAACIILAQGVTLDENVLNVAKTKGINVLTTALPAYEAALLLAENIR